MYDVVQVAGSLLILAAFAGALLGQVDQRGRRYLLANAVGSATLAATALLGREWGFLLLEGTWALVSLGSLARRAALRPASAPLPAHRAEDEVG
ncbi:CBU_0592 family membrane protein [Frankia sp. AgKG'84/4]|uniref:CBU_0592 family membrane protein n=1 Tax=Frankia sp. AgKG'84/4 TaxID=573490 RepID=UPI00200F5E9E|nr:hypothetical protein [Frankia sp. AgKG'84/4]MCL9793430.1 hypothetical protein [Frankia sp. AgKG'84/4]